MFTIDNYLDSHYIHRSNWLKAAVSGANDGIISISSLVLGLAAASTTREPIILAPVKGFAAGTLSIAAVVHSSFDFLVIPIVVIINSAFLSINKPTKLYEGPFSVKKTSLNIDSICKMIAQDCNGVRAKMA